MSSDLQGPSGQDMPPNAKDLKNELDEIEIEESVDQALLVLRDDEAQGSPTPPIPNGKAAPIEVITEIDNLSDAETNDVGVTNVDSIVALRSAQQDRVYPAKKKSKKRVEAFYKKQDTVIDSFAETTDLLDNGVSAAEDRAKKDKAVTRAVRISMACNVFLLIAKAIAVYLSGSIAIISSLLDSAIDLLSGIIIWISSRAIKKTNIYKYPVGKRRLEPLAILVLSSIMAICAVQIIVESIDRIVKKSDVNLETGSIVVMCITIVMKFFLFIYCKRLHSPSTDTLALDHRNDTMSNSVALGCGLIATYVWVYADPIGAILMSMYIAYNWYLTGAVQIKQLAGKTAPPEFLQKITWICLHHDDRIAKIDTVKGFHIGYHYIVEVHIVLAEEMTLKEAHNIGESLQCKIEKLHDVERAFVHLDYEFDHDPNIEHKTV